MSCVWEREIGILVNDHVDGRFGQLSDGIRILR